MNKPAKRRNTVEGAFPEIAYGTISGKLMCVALLAVAIPMSASGKDVCFLFQDLPSHRNQSVEIAGQYHTADLNDALNPGDICRYHFETKGYRWAAGVVLVFPRNARGEDVFPGRAGGKLRELLQQRKQHSTKYRVSLVVRGRVRMKDDYGFGLDNGGQVRAAYGYGHSKVYAAEFEIDQILKVRKVEVVP